MNFNSLKIYILFRDFLGTLDIGQGVGVSASSSHALVSRHDRRHGNVPRGLRRCGALVQQLMLRLRMIAVSAGAVLQRRRQ